MKKKWRFIPGYEGLYLISTQGEIASLKYGNKRIIKILHPTTKKGYLKVSLVKDGIRKTYRVHRLVALTFLPVPGPGQTQVNHINGIKLDNRVENLCWCTPKENRNNPATIQNCFIRYHKDGEFERRRAGQIKRFSNPQEREKAKAWMKHYWNTKKLLFSN